MPTRINCPSCNTALSLPESMYGKTVRCPGCQQMFQCPNPGSVAPGPPPPPPRRSAPPPPSSGNPFDFAPAPEAGFVDDEDDEPRGRRPRRSAGWDRVRGGFLFLYLSAGCFTLCYLLLFFFAGDATGGGRSGPSGPGPSPGTIKAVLTFLSVLFVAGTVLGGIGLASCGSVPAETRARIPVTVGMVCMILCAVSSVVISFMVLPTIFGDKPPTGLKVLPILVLATTGSLMASFILFTFFLTLAAVHLQRWGLLASIITYVVVMSLSPLAIFGLTYFQLLLSGPRMAASDSGTLIKFLSVTTVVGGAVWFCLMLVTLNSAIDRLRGRGRD
jgi:hypothetical protein